MKNLKVFNHTRGKVRKQTIHKIVFRIVKYLNLKIEDLEINFVDDETILEINKKYLNHNYTTDIITFNYSEDNSILEGEIFISVDDAKRNAKKFNVPFENEIVRLVIHGILHMIGFDDIDPKQKKVMKKKENELVDLIWEEKLIGDLFNDN